MADDLNYGQFQEPSYLPYDALVDYARGNAAASFGQPREMTKQEKLDATLGGLQTFFARIARIGTPPGQQQDLAQIEQEGLLRTQKAINAPKEDMNQSMMQQAAMKRAQLEQQQLQQQIQDHKMNAQAKLAEMMRVIGPDLGPDISQGPPGPNDMPPSDLLSQAAKTGEWGPVIGSRFYHPGLGEERKQGEIESRQLAREKAIHDAQAKEKEVEWERGEPMRRADIAYKNAATEAMHKKGEAGGFDMKHADVRKEIDGLMNRYKDSPRKQLGALNAWVSSHSDLNLPQPSIDYIKSTLASLSKAGGSSDESPSITFKSFSAQPSGQSPSGPRPTEF